MAQIAGTVKSITGYVTARDSEGEIRVLGVGDVVNKNDVIITAPGSNIVITLANGNELQLDGGKEFVLDDTVLENAEVQDAEAEAQALQEALLRGEAIEEGDTAAGNDLPDAVTDFASWNFLPGDTSQGDVGAYLLDSGQSGAEDIDRRFDGADANNTNNRDAVANPDESSTIEDNNVTIDVLANDSDPDGDPVSFVVITEPANGTVVLNEDGTVTYTPNDDFYGDDSFTYTITDGQGGESTTTVSVTVDPENDAPVAVNDTQTVGSDGVININVLADDTDADGDTLEVIGVTDPDGGTVVINSDGTITYTPDEGFSGTDTFEYTISDGKGGESTATVTVEVPNFAPEAANDTATLAEDASLVIPVLDNDTDANSDDISVVTTTEPAHGTVTVNSDGTITYTPEANYNGADTFTYTISDGKGGVDTATVNLTVTPENDAPVAVDDTQSVDEDGSVNINVLTNDTDIDGDDLSVTSATDPANGTVTVNTDGTITYSPDANFNGVDTFEYTISDGKGGESTATVTVDVAALNDGPVAEDDSATLAEDAAATVIPVLPNDTDIDGDELSVASVTQPAHGTVAIVNGEVVYTPEANYNGADSFTYTISDGKGGVDTATVNLTVTPENDAPVAVDDTQSVDEDGSVNISVLTNDTDIDGDDLSVTSATDPANGTVTVNTDGTITYSPDANFNGVDTFEYTISDGKGGESTATVTVDVAALNDGPVAEDDSATLAEDAAATVIPVLPNDTDIDGDELSVASVTQPAHGTVAIVNGEVVYTPEANYNGADSFTYTISDGKGGVDTATVNLTVTPENDAPVAVDDTQSVDEDGSVNISVLTNDTDIDGDDLSVTSATDPANGTVTVNTDGTITYSPDANFNGVDTFEYTISDGKGGESTATVTVDVAALNDGPVAEDDSATLAEDAAATVIPVLTNDTDIDGDELSVASVTQPAHGTVAIVNGEVVYTPEANYNGADTFTYTISDGKGGVDTATVNLTVTPENDAPVAVDDTQSVDEDGSVNINVLTNDTDIDGDELSVTSATDPANGTVTVNTDGTITYSPDANFNGVDTFEYTISDGKGGESTATVTVDVAALNDGPVAEDDSATLAEDAAATVIPVLPNDTDIDGDELSVASVTQPAHGTVAIVNGEVVYTPEANYNGADSFTYTISDGKGGVDTATVNLTVTPENDAPVAVDDTQSVDEDGSVNISVLTNDTDIDGDDLSVTSATDPANGTVTVNTDGTITYSPDANFNGVDTFEYTISDGKGGESTATVTVDVAALNDGPVAEDDSATLAEDAAATVIPVLPNDTDIDGDELSVASVTQPAHGTVAIVNGEVVYTPEANYNGADSFTYTISDGKGGVDTATVNLTVTPENDAPVAVDDTQSVDEDGSVNISVLPNDTDIDGDDLSVTSATDPANGTVTVNTDGTITYSPDANFNGVDTFDYTISDGKGGESTATVTVDVAALNDGPVAEDDSATLAEDAAATVIPVLPNDTDIDGDELSVASVTQPAHGTVAIVNGEVIYTPEANYNGADSFTYTISDGKGGVDTATVNLTVTPENDAPVAVDDTQSVDEDGSVNINVLTNDTDIDGDDLSVTSATDPANGTVTVNTDGTITYSPDANFNGVDTFEYTISDGKGGESTATVTVDVAALNDGPVAEDDSATLAEDAAATVIPVLPNDTDIDGDELSVASVTQPAHGTVAIVNGEVVYTPEANYNGADSFTYTISDGKGGVDTATVNLTVTPENDAPVAVDDTQSVDEDGSVNISVLTNDTDIDGDDLSVTSATDPANGTVTVNTDGTITYSPDANFNGVDTFEYTISDGKGGESTATVTVDVAALNDGPVAEDDSATLAEDAAATVIPVLPNDTDIDGDELSVASVTQPAHGTVAIVNGEVVYTPEANYNGADSFTYTISDGKGGVDTATVNLTVTPENDAPVAVDDTQSVDEDGSVNISVLTNDTDIDGDDLSVTSATDPANGTVTVNTDGTITYSPDANFNGVDTFEYTISDGKGGESTATVTVDVAALNDGPVAEDDSATLAEDAAATVIPVLTNDTDIDGDELSVASVTQPAHGTVAIVNGEVVYTPEANYNGADTFTYTISDGKGGVDTATVNLTVTPENDAPVAVDDTQSVDEDGSVNINVLTNDTDIDGDELSVTSATDPANGTVTVNTDGTITYSPDANFNGVDTFEYTISDGKGGESTATVTVDVAALNDGPVAEDDSATLAEDAAATVIPVLPNDTDIDGDELSVASVTQPAHGTVAIVNGEVVYTPEANYNGADSFTYTISDGKGGVDTATVNLTVTPENDAPVAVDDTQSVDEDGSVNISVLTNDTDIDGDDLSVTSATDPANGTVTVNTDGTITYSPDANFNGVDTFEYTISDGKGGESTATVTVDVAALNDGPVAEDDSATLAEDAAATVIPVLPNDTDIDGDELSVASVTQPAHGTVAIVNGEVVYTPEANYNGADTFTYTISDGKGGVDTATVNLTVTPENDAPVAVDDTQSVDEDGSVNINVLTNDTDIDGDELSVTSATDPANGTVTVNTDGTITYSPDANFNGVDTFEYTISDGKGGESTATVTVDVAALNDGPVAEDDSATLAEDAAATVIPVLTNDTDIDGDELSVASVTQPAHGTVAIVNGEVVYTPEANYNGADTFTYTISDGKGGVDTATVNLTVTPENDAPVAVDDTQSVDEDGSVNINVLTNDTDIDGDELSVTSATDPANGTVTVNTDGTITYSPDANFNGVDTFEYTISDGKGGESTATVTVDVAALNDGPVAEDDSATLAEDAAATVIPVLPNDTDIDGDELSVASVTQPAHGTVAIVNGEVVYTPEANYNGADSFTYTISDGKGGVDTATVNLTVTPENDAPVAVDDTQSVDEDGSVNISVLPNDTDIDGDDLSVTSATDPANGTVTVNTDGTITYSPDANFNGVDTFDYTISDGKGGESTATVTVDVAALNDGPETSDKTVEVNEDGSVVFSLDDFDQGGTKDVEDDAEGESTSIVIESLPEHGTLFYTDDDGNEVELGVGDEVADATRITYEVDEGYNSTIVMGTKDVDGVQPQWGEEADGVLTYEAPNGVTATITAYDTDGTQVDVGFNNQINHEKGLGIGVDGASGDDGQIDTGEKLTVSFNSAVSNAVIGLGGLGGHYDNSGSPVAEANWEAYLDGVLVSSGSIQRDGDYANEVDLSGVTFDSIEFYNTSVGGNSNHVVQFIEFTNADLTDSFDYSAVDSDGLASEGTSTVSLSIPKGAEADYNVAPEAEDDSFSVVDGSAEFTLADLTSDFEDDNDGDATTNTTIKIESLPENGTLYDADGNEIIEGQVIEDADGIRYELDGSIDTTAVLMGSKGDGEITDWGTVEDGAITFEAGDVKATISSPDGPIGFSTIEGLDSHEGFGIGVDTNSGDDGQIDMNETIEIDFESPVANATIGLAGLGGHFEAGSVDAYASWTAYLDGEPVASGMLQNDDGDPVNSFTVSEQFDSIELSVTVESGINSNYTIQYIELNSINDSFEYVTIDSEGKESDVATVTLDVEPSEVLTAEHAPDAVNDNASLNEDGSIDVNVLANDTDLDGDSLEVIGATDPANGTVTVNADGTITYTPDADFNGVDTFEYTISDGQGGTDKAVVTIDVAAINDGPVAEDDTTSVAEDASLIIPVLGNDEDVDGDTLEITDTTDPEHGTVTVNADGTITYTPDADYNGADSFTYTISDGKGGTDTATVNLTVTPENDVPVAVDDTKSVDEDGNVNINVLGNDLNPDGGELSVDSFTQPANGTVVQNADGTFTYSPSDDFSGDDSFTYTVVDASGDTSTSTVNLTVNPVADTPVITLSVSEGELVAGEAASNLVVNGSFEDVTGQTKSGYNISNYDIRDGGYKAMTSMTGWTLISDSADSMEVHDAGHMSIGATDGENYMDLGETNSSDTDLDNSHIGQVIEGVQDGESYTLTFDYTDKAAAAGDNESGQLTVIWGGAVVAVIDGDNTDWDSFDVELIGGAGNGNNQLEFKETGTGNDNHGMAIDNVEIMTTDTSAGDTVEYTLDLDANVTDTNGEVSYESLSSITISGVPEGATLDVGTKNADGTWTIDVNDAEYHGDIVMNVPADQADGFEITASVKAIESGNGDISEIATATADVEMPVNAAPDAADDFNSVTEAGSAEGDAPTATATLTEVEGSGGTGNDVSTDPDDYDNFMEVGDITGNSNASIRTHSGDSYIHIEDVNWWANVNCGSGDDIIHISGDVNRNLNINGGSGSDTVILGKDESSYTVRWMSNNNGQISAGLRDNDTGENIQINNVEDIQYGGISEATVEYEVDIALTPADGEVDSYTLSVTGATLNQGTDNGDGTWTVTPDEVAGLRAIPDGSGSDVAVGEVAVSYDPADYVVEDAGDPVATGNVLSNDSDEEGDDLSVTEVDGNDVDGETVIDGQYGTLTINSDGSYSYELDNANEDVDGLGDGETLRDVFEYTVSDGTGDATANLNITINGASDVSDNVAPEITVESLETTVSFVSEEAAYDNVIGLYGMVDGEPVLVKILETNTDYGQTHEEFVEGNFGTYAGDGSDLQFFIIADGHKDGVDFDTITFEKQSDGSYKAQYDDDGETVTLNNNVYFEDPAMNHDNADHFRVVENDDGTKTVEIEDLAAPGWDADFQDIVLDMETTGAVFTEGEGAIYVATDVSISDVDDTDMTELTVTLENAQEGDVLTVDEDMLPEGISYTVEGNVVTFTNESAITNFEGAAQAVMYENTSNTPVETDREFTFTVSDGESISNTAALTIAVESVNAAPFIDLDGVATDGIDNEVTFDGAAVAIADVNAVLSDDVDITEVEVAIVDGQPEDALVLGTMPPGINAELSDDGQTVVLTGDVSTADFETALKEVSFDTASASLDERQVSVTASDADGECASAQTVIEIDESIAAYTPQPTIDMFDNVVANAFDNCGHASVQTNDEGYYAALSSDEYWSGDSDSFDIDSSEAMVFDIGGSVNSVTFNVNGEVAGSTWDIYDANGHKIDYSDGSCTADGRDFPDADADGNVTFTSTTPFSYIAFDGGDESSNHGHGRGHWHNSDDSDEASFSVKPIGFEAADSDGNNILGILDEGGAIDFSDAAEYGSIESLQMTGEIDQSITNLSVENVFNMTDDDNILQIVGGENDQVDMSEWTDQGNGMFSGTADDGSDVTVQISGDFSFDADSKIITFDDNNNNDGF